MSTFRKYGGTQFSAINNVTRSFISNSEHMNINGVSGQLNTTETFLSSIDMSGNSILHTGTLYFQDGTSISTANNIIGGSETGATGPTGPRGPAGSSLSGGATGPTGTNGAMGPAGTNGATGPAGTNGTNGTDGTNGTNGAMGPTGTDGATGPAGTNGATGPAGAMGNQGLESYGMVNNFGGNWNELSTDNNINWSSVAISESGQYQTAVSSGSNTGLIYVSNNFGISWNPYNNLLYDWKSIAISSTGQYQTALIDNGSIYISNNYGVLWSLVSGTSNTWTSICMSSSGQNQLAVTSGNLGLIFVSSNYGLNWQQVNVITGNFISASLSSSGQYQTVVSQGTNGLIYISSDFGVSWNSNSSVVNDWQSVSISQTGQYQTICAQYSNNIYISNNYGASWNPILITSSYSNFYSVSVSGNGQYQSAVVNGIGGLIYISNNYGVNWSYVSNITAGNWTSVAVSTNGQYILTSSSGYQLYLSNANINGPVGATGPAGTNGVTGPPGATGSAGTNGDNNWTSYDGVLWPTTIENYVGIGTTAPQYPLDVNGTVNAISFNSASDYRIKDNVLQLNDSFTVDKLRPVTYNNTKLEKQDIGLIAHELQEIYPFLVNGEKDGENFQSVNYTGLIGILIKEIQVLKERVSKLEQLEKNWNN